MYPSTLRDRLRDVIRKPDSAGSRALPQQHDAPRPALLGPPPPLEDTLGGTWRDSACGRSFVVRRRVPPHDIYGAYRIEEFAECIQRTAMSARMLGATEACEPFVFFDLETTGLSGGAGTYAFLVGCAWFDADGGLVTDQHLMTDYAGERSMLSVVADDLGRAGTLVTFNGKSFDAPVVETRYLYHRCDSPCADLPHVDVLHPARRFWGGASDAGCTLTTLESQVLGARRSGDVPGFEIPARYFQFIRSGDARPLAAVLEHNRLDLLSLAGLTARLFHLVNAGPDATEDAREALALGRVYGQAGRAAHAEAAFERAVVLTELADRRSVVRVEALRALALQARRTRRFDTAAERWRQLLEVPACPRLIAREATEALAIHNEHRARDLTAAKAFALRSLEFEVNATWGDAVRHRLARIERKMVSERPLVPSSSLQPSFGFRTSVRRTSS